MTSVGHDTLKTRSTLSVGGRQYAYYSLNKASLVLGDVSRLPFSMKVLLENLVRSEDGVTVTLRRHPIPRFPARNLTRFCA